LAALILARPSPLLLILGLSLAALGEVVRIWAAGHLVKGRELTRSGPYAWTRNPLYLGSSLIAVGFCVAAGRWELFVLLGVLLIGIYVPVIRAEAGALRTRFPRAYKDYAESVPLFIPRIGRKANRSAERHFSWERVWANKEYETLAGWSIAAGLFLWKMG
jgi:protein-S-isoprenylcysteine O-methyltransferase Ste14